MSEENKPKEDSALEQAMAALTVFADQYVPATKETATDYFPSRQIQEMIFKHTGTCVEISEIFKLLTQMSYQYMLQDDEFVWMVRNDE